MVTAPGGLQLPRCCASLWTKARRILSSALQALLNPLALGSAGRWQGHVECRWTVPGWRACWWRRLAPGTPQTHTLNLDINLLPKPNTLAIHPAGGGDVRQARHVPRLATLLCGQLCTQITQFTVTPCWRLPVLVGATMC